MNIDSNKVKELALSEFLKAVFVNQYRINLTCAFAFSFSLLTVCSIFSLLNDGKKSVITY